MPADRSAAAAVGLLLAGAGLLSSAECWGYDAAGLRLAARLPRKFSTAAGTCMASATIMTLRDLDFGMDFGMKISSSILA